MRLTKIYTKKGDKGSTQLAHGEVVAKNSPRIEAYGTVDELNSFLGVLKDQLRRDDSKGDLQDLVDRILKIQNEMHDIGGELATLSPTQIHPRQTIVKKETIERLETEIDNFNLELAPLANFVLPGGHLCNSWGHVCRTICRRAERLVYTLSQTSEVRPEVIAYLNRLSDWLFVTSRIISKRLGVLEVLWNQQDRPKSPSNPHIP